jgi:hypothetical protein
VIMVEFMVVFLLREKGAYFRISYDCMGWWIKTEDLDDS